MKSLFAFMKKEYKEALRTGKLVILVILFVLFGIINPAVAKLTPWITEMMSESLAESGMVITSIQVNAMTSWAQFFKNIPIALIAFVLIFSDIFTKEYKSGTLLLVLTKGLARYKVVLAKAMLLLPLWTFGYLLCFGITYGYNAYFWDNGIANNLFFSAAVWWLFGTWVICLIVFFSALMQNNTGVTLCTGALVLLSYLLCLIPKAKAYSPVMLMKTGELLSGTAGTNEYIKAVVITAVLCIICIAVSIPIMNKRQL